MLVVSEYDHGIEWPKEVRGLENKILGGEEEVKEQKSQTLEESSM